MLAPAMSRLSERALRLLAFCASAASAASAALAVLLPACRTGRIDIYSCEDPCYTCDDPCDPCPGGECVPVPPLGWEGPVLLWTGAEADAPECPSEAPVSVYEGHDGLEAIHTCPACACEPAGCRAPEGLVASDLTCPGDGPGSSQQPIAIDDGWQDTCVATPAVPDGQLASLVFLAPELGACTPVTGSETSASVTWARLARACRAGTQTGACDDLRQQCATAAEGFRQCVFRDGDDEACPEGYPERQVFYRGLDGSLGCTECTCGAPEDGDCAARITTYAELGCPQSKALASADVAIDQPKCVDVQEAGALRSASLTIEVSTPGTCPPAGGEPIGEVEPADPSTFCCRP